MKAQAEKGKAFRENDKAEKKEQHKPQLEKMEGGKELTREERKAQKNMPKVEEWTKVK